jgi:hypothetical protein
LVPEVPFTNYSGEHFYWNATAGSRAGNAVLVLGLEGAFNTADPAAGEQVVFGRLRITIPRLPLSGDYKVYTPFGDFSFPGLSAGDRLFFTSDIGIGCGADFSCALNSLIGPFLLPSKSPGGGEVPPIPDLVKGSGVDPWYDALPAVTPYPGTGKKYISDPARVGPVTGSPLPPFVSPADGLTYDHNRFRIEVNGVLLSDDVNFTTAGRLMTATIPASVKVNRASYSASAAGNKLDVYGTAAHAVAGRVPAAAQLPPTPPDLGYYDAPCATDPTTGVVIGPPAVPGLLYFQMLSDGNGKWWGGNAPATVPPQVCVQDLNARDAAGNVIPAYFLGNVTDEVHINWASVMWDPTLGGGTLTVSAASSDTVNAPVLTLQGYTLPGAAGPVPAVLTGGTVTISPLAAPADKVTVVSTRGGRATLDTTTGVGIPVSTTVPVANADTFTTLEDTPVPSFNVLANDTLGGSALPAGSIVTITAAPRLGSATLNLDNTITYTPAANANGTDIIGYTVAVGTATSPEGYFTIIITPVNDPPVAVADAGGAPNNKAVTFNLLANDTDPDGAADLAAAVIATLPVNATLTCGGLPAGVGTACAGGLVTFTATAQGTPSFTYRARDQQGALSAAAATMTVTVGGAEAIVVSKSQYVVSKNRWVVTGTDSANAGQTLTIAYTGGTYKVAGACTGNAAGAVVGTADVVAGAWAFDQILTSAGVLNPGNTGGNSAGFWCTPPRQISITSPLGGTATANIVLK